MRTPVPQGSPLPAADRALVSVELQRFFSHSWNLRLGFLIIPAIWLSLWQHAPSPFVPIFGALFIGLEPQFCNIFFRTPNELEALSVLAASVAPHRAGKEPLNDPHNHDLSADHQHHCIVFLPRYRAGARFPEGRTLPGFGHFSSPARRQPPVASTPAAKSGMANG